MDKHKEKIFEDWRDSLDYDEQTLYEYLDTIKAYVDFAEYYKALTIHDVVGRSEQCAHTSSDIKTLRCNCCNDCGEILDVLD